MCFWSRSADHSHLLCFNVHHAVAWEHMNWAAARWNQSRGCSLTAVSQSLRLNRGRDQESLKCMQQGCQPPFFLLTDPIAQPCLHHVPLLLQQEGNMCWPWISRLFILAWVWGCSLEHVHSVSSGEENPQEGHQAHKPFGSRCVLSFQHRAVLAQCIPALALGMLQQALGYCFHLKAFSSTQAADFKYFRNIPGLTEICLVIDF